MGIEDTTIKLNRKTKERLDNLKEHNRETYQQVIEKILYILNVFRKNSLLGNKALSNLDKSIKRRQAFDKQGNKED